MHLTCDPIEPDELTEMNCELGMVAVQVVNIENPLNTELRLDCLSNIPTVFTIQPKGTLQIEAH